MSEKDTNGYSETSCMNSGQIPIPISLLIFTLLQGLRSKEEKLLAEKKHQRMKKRKSKKKWEKLMDDRSVYNSFITRGLIG